MQHYVRSTVLFHPSDLIQLAMRLIHQPLQDSSNNFLVVEQRFHRFLA